jgi:hypothetical protein
MLRATCRLALAILIGSLLTFIPGRAAVAQSSDAGSVTRSLVNGKIDGRHLVTYKNSVPQPGKALTEVGRAGASQQVQGEIVMHRPLEMQKAVDLLEQRVHTAGDPLYHQWLTAKELAAFGPSEADVAALTGWLKSQDLQVTNVSLSRLVVDFSGAVADEERAFHTQIHEYRAADGTEYFANTTNPKAPRALNALIYSPIKLNNFSPIAMQNYAGQVVSDAPKTATVPAKPVDEQSEAVSEGIISNAALATFTVTDTPGTQTQGTSTAQTLVVTLRGSTGSGAISGTLTITNPTIGTIESVSNVATAGAGCTEGTSTHAYTCTFTWNPAAALAGGTYVLTANYGGGGNYSAGTATVNFVVLGSTATTTTDTANPSEVTFDNPTTTVTSVTTWTGSGATPTGTVKLSCSAASAGTCGTLPAAENLTSCTINTSAKTFTCSISYALDSDDSAFGTYYMVMSYSGDGTYAPSASTANPAPVVDSDASSTDTTVSASPASAAVGAGTSITYTVNITDVDFAGVQPTGTMMLSGTPITGGSTQITVNATNCPYNEDTAVATCTIVSAVPVATAAGSYTVTAAYSGDTNYVPSSGTTNFNVTGSTATSMTSSAAPIVVTVGTPTTTVTSVTTWTGSGATPTGTVTLSCGSGSAGTCTSLPAAKNVSSCTINTSAKTISCAIAYALDSNDDMYGAYNMVSTYSGDSVYKGASSTTVVTDSEGDTSTTTLTLVPASVVYGAGTSVVYTAKVVGSSGAGRPAGTITLTNPTLGTIGTINIPTNCTGTTSTTYTCTLTAAVPAATAVGAYTITATYSGSLAYLSSTGTATLTVTKATPVAAASNESGGFQSTVTLSATDTGASSGAAAPAGTVTFMVNSATVSGTPTCTSSADVETCTLSYALPAGLTAGMYPITAVFAAGPNYNASNTASATLTVTTDATSTSVAASPNSLTAAGTTTLTATVTNTTASGVTPTGGTVTFTDTTNSAALGSCTLSAGTCSVSNVSGGLFASGANTVQASYGGVTNQFGASTGTTAVTITGPANGYITFTSVSHNFGQVAVGTAATFYSLQITNSGTAAYTFGLNFTPSKGFTSATNCPSSIAVGGKCELAFYFTPTATGPVSTTWSLASETGFGYTPSNGGTLSGSGTSQGGVSVTTAGRNFGTVPVGTTSPTYGVELSNSTSAAVTLTKGMVTAPFAVATNCGATLAAGASCELEFTFTPTGTSTVQQVYMLSGSTMITVGGNPLPNGGITLTGN